MDLSDPLFWKQRLEEAPTNCLHYAVYKCRPHKWNAIGEAHRKILAELIQSNDSILDVGCGYGHLVGLLPMPWTGQYLGIDISPDLIEIAKKHWPKQSFIVGDAR